MNYSVFCPLSLNQLLKHEKLNNHACFVVPCLSTFEISGKTCLHNHLYNQGIEKNRTGQLLLQTINSFTPSSGTRSLQTFNLIYLQKACQITLKDMSGYPAVYECKANERGGLLNKN